MNVPRRRSTLIKAAAAALLSALACSGTDAATPPNVLLIVADDLGWGDVGYHGGQIPTPNIDRLASEGIEFERFYAQPLCTATRAGLLTGRSAIRFGMQYHPLTPGSQVGLSSSEFGMAQAFVAAGYSTALLGKWHLGYSDADFLPNAHGFEHFYGHLMAGLDYFEHRFPAGGHDWQRNGVSVRESGYSTFLLGEEAITLIRSRANRPFFLMLSFNAPHVPVQAPEALLREFAHLEGETRRSYAAVIAAMDRTIGSVLEVLDEEGISERTIVLFLSDNGGFHRYASNAPLRGAKRSTGEGGIRVVAALRWSGVLEPGRSDQFVSHLDVLPTLASAAGVDSPRANGDVHLAVIAAGEKLVQLRRADGAREERLYDIVIDPGESRNLAAERSERVAELGAAIDAWRALHPADGIRNLAPPRLYGCRPTSTSSNRTTGPAASCQTETQAGCG